MLEHKFELLAPAGSLPILKAVIDAGADAVYVGGRLFGARAYAENFSTEELLCGLDYAHLGGKKVYLTVNTLLKNRELSTELYDYLKVFYEHGLDAVLVQDFGVLQFIRRNFPLLPIHASTQMTVCGSGGAAFLAQQGVTRAVLSRELSIPEMQEIRAKTGMELEVFVHGALCYSYSGQCLFSSMLGGRSGNRGRCAQPCRLPYSVLDGKKKTVLQDSYVLSLKDLCGLSDLPRLAEAGVYSLKIEGRMKQLPYARGVVSLYRQYIDLFCGSEKGAGDFALSEEDYRKLLDYGNRCGFTDGYYHKQNGEDMVTFVKPSYKKGEGGPQNRGDAAKGTENYLPIQGTLMLQKDKPACLALCQGKIKVQVQGDVVCKAKTRPLSEAEVKARITKTGETSFVFSEMDIRMDEDIFYPNGALNALRREGIRRLEEAMLVPYRRECAGNVPAALGQGEKGNGPGNREPEEWIAVISRRSQLKEVLALQEFTTVYLSAEAYPRPELIAGLQEDAVLARGAGKKVYFRLPAIFRRETADFYERQAPDLAKIPMDGMVVRNYESILFVQKNCCGLPFVTDYSLYTFNDWAARGFYDAGALADTIPLELNAAEIAHRDNGKSIMVLYGYYPLMVSAQCVRSNTAGCSHKPGIMYLRDRYKKLFPVQNCCSDCYNVLYNSVPTLLIPHLGELRQAGIRRFRLDFSLEGEEEIKQVLGMFQRAYRGEEIMPAGDTSEQRPKGINYGVPFGYTRGHYRRGVE